MYNIYAFLYVGILPGNILVRCKLLPLPSLPLHRMEIVQVDTRCVTACPVLNLVFGHPQSGLVGIEDAEQHGVSGVNAGHWHFS